MLNCLLKITVLCHPMFDVDTRFAIRLEVYPAYFLLIQLLTQLTALFPYNLLPNFPDYFIFAFSSYFHNDEFPLQLFLKTFY